MRVVLAVVLFSVPAWALDEFQFPEHTLQQFEKELPPPVKELYFSPSSPGVSLRVKTTGQSRPLTAENKKFLGRHTGMVADGEGGAPVPILSMYSSEVRVEEVGSKRSLWLPIQEKILQALKQEVPTGTSTLLYLRFLGFHEKRAHYIVIDFPAP